LNLYFSTVAAELAAQRVQLIARSGQYRVNLCNDTAATEYRTDDLNDAIKQADISRVGTGGAYAERRKSKRL